MCLCVCVFLNNNNDHQLLVPWMRWFLPPEQRRHLNLVLGGPDPRSALWFNNYVQALLRRWGSYTLTQPNAICTEELHPFLVHIVPQRRLWHISADSGPGPPDGWGRALIQEVQFGPTWLAAAVIKGHFAVCSSTWGWIVLWSKAGLSEPRPQGPQPSWVFCPRGPSRPRLLISLL